MAEGGKQPEKSLEDMTPEGKTVLPPLFYFLTESNINQIIVTISENIEIINAMI